MTNDLQQAPATYSGRGPNFALWLILIVVGVFGLFEPFMPDTETGQGLILLQTLTLTVLVAYWCYLDERSRGSSLPRWLLWIIAIFGLFALPLHLFRSRPPKLALIALLKALLFTAFAIGVFAVAMVASYHLLCATGIVGFSCSPPV